MSTKLIVILGPTATGKSDLAVSLAKKLSGEIISADSRQVYKGLDIGTGKITKKEMKGIRHHLLDVADPKSRFTVVKYVELAEKAISEIVSRGKLPIVCGGTGFYIQALIDGIAIPDVPPNKLLRAKLNKMSPEKLLAILKKLDRKRYEVIDKQNIRRVIRSIEIATVLGKVPELEKSSGRYDSVFIGLSLPSAELRKRIGIRLKKRIAKGMINEARNLHLSGKLSWKRMEELGLEYRYLALYLRGEISKEDMARQLETEIWHYARRQMTWWRKDKRIRWVEAPTRLSL